MTENEARLLSRVADSVSGRREEETNKEILKSALDQGVLLFVNAELPVSEKQMAQNFRVYYAHADIHRVLSGIPYVFLKGYASATYYAEPTLRLGGDVDFLVKPEDMEEVRKRLLAGGFEEVEADNDHHDVFKKDDITFEPHYRMSGMPDGAVGARIEAMLSDVIEKAVVTETPYGAMALPTPFHHGLIQLLHVANHMTSTGVGLRHLLDWAVFVKETENFRELFEAPLKQVGLWTYACLLTQVSERYLGIPKNDWTGEPDEALTEAVMEDVLAAGNFGYRREDNREYWLNSNVGAGGVKYKNPVAQLFHNMNQVTRLHWPAAKKNVLLLPIGAVYFGGRYLFRSLTGKRKKVRVGKMFAGAKSRRRLYEKFRLFEA